MIHTAKYRLITISPQPERLDVLAFGAVIHSDLGWTVSLSENIGKLLAINPDYDTGSLSESASRIKDFAGDCRDLNQLTKVMKSLGTRFQLDTFEGRFGYANEVDHADQIKKIMNESVDSGKERSVVDPRPRSMLRATLRKQFSALGILAKDQSDINDHKVVQRFPIEASQGLYADFALKNSCMHITATVDFTTSQQAYTAKKYEAQAKCLVLRAASDICGRDTRKYVVVAGGEHRNSNSALNLLRANAEIFRFEDADDMAKYLEVIQNAALGFSPLH